MTPRIAVVVPCFRVGTRVLDVIARIGPEVGWIFVVDDACPERTGEIVASTCNDARVQVIALPRNRGVGGAVVAGYRAALETACTVVVKIDGDGQMDAALIPTLAAPVLAGDADYTKGNRFHHVRSVASMPAVRLIGNAALSFLAKLSTGYWQLFDPTNGFTCAHRAALAELALDHVSERYFFESDMLYALNEIRAVIAEMPMRAHYDGAPSSLVPSRVFLPFLAGHLRNLSRRLFYNYLLRGFSIASVSLLVAPPLIAFGAGFGLHAWYRSIVHGEPATAGTVMLAALPIILGSQFLLSWLSHDIAAEPRVPLQRLLAGR